jgi:uncharacterized protein
MDSIHKGLFIINLNCKQNSTAQMERCFPVKALSRFSGEKSVRSIKHLAFEVNVQNTILFCTLNLTKFHFIKPMYISRTAEAVLARMLQSRKVSLILGARQVGKTTLVERVLCQKKATFLNLDIEVDKQRLLAAASLSPEEAARVLGQPDILVVDEAQRLPETSRIVKGWYDARLPLKVVLLGSSSLDLASRSVESLTGRHEKLLLPPLLFREILAAQPWHSNVFSDDQLLEHFPDQIQTLLLQSMACGHYPEAVTTADSPGYLLQLASDYLWKDILQLGMVKTPELIRRLLMLLAHQVGSLVSVNELANSLDMARPTVERYLDLLEQTFVIFRLSAFSTNPRKEISKSQKVYFWDTGIRNALLNDMATHPLRPDIGALWENWVIAEFAKENVLRGGRKKLFFWRSRSGSEVDLIVQADQQLKAYEIKWKRRRPATRAFAARYEVEVQVIDRTHPLVEL